MWLYRLVRAFLLAAVTVNANYFVSNDSTSWSTATCKLAEPNLTYINEQFEVDNTTAEQINATDVWIGYQLAKMPFLFLGCGKLNNKATHNITTIGDCFHLCDGGTFGIKPVSGDDILSNHLRRCVNQPVRHPHKLRETYITKHDKQGMHKCEASPDSNTGNQHGFCDKQYVAIFMPIYVKTSDVSQSNTSGDCLLYYFPGFVWGECKRIAPLQVLCGKGPYTAEIIVDHSSGAKTNWSDANGNCLKPEYHPASIESIKNSKFDEINTQFYWTGIIRSTAIIKSTRADKFETNPLLQFAILKNGSRVLHFASDCVNKKALCIRAPETTSAAYSGNISKSTVNPTCLPSTESSKSSDYPDDFSKHSTTDILIYRSHMPDISTDKIPVRVGIGVAVGVLCVVGAVIVIIVLRRRGVLSCKLGTKTAEPDAGNLAFASRSYEETVGNHNYFILEKGTQSIGDHADHYNTAEEINEDNLETDNYNSINDTEEPYQSVEDDYDYTTNAFRTGANTGKPDNLYSKIKIDLPGDYDHVGRRGHNMSEPDNDYDITALAQKNDGDVDYNHIPRHVSTSFERRNETDDLAHEDYDIINGLKVKFPSSDAPGYSHVKI